MKYITPTLLAALSFLSSDVLASTALNQREAFVNGSVKLTRPLTATSSNAAEFRTVAGAKIANLSLSGAIEAQNTLSETLSIPEGVLETVTGSLQRSSVNNAAILRKVLDASSNREIRGWSLRVIFFYNENPVIIAYKKNQAPVVVPSTVLTLDASWPVSFDGPFRGSASWTVNDTASGTAINFNRGFTARGFNSYTGNLQLGTNPAIIYSGVGSFTENFKGVSGSARVSGDNFNEVLVPNPNL